MTDRVRRWERVSLGLFVLAIVATCACCVVGEAVCQIGAGALVGSLVGFGLVIAGYLAAAHAYGCDG